MNDVIRISKMKKYEKFWNYRNNAYLVKIYLVFEDSYEFFM